MEAAALKVPPQYLRPVKQAGRGHEMACAVTKTAPSSQDPTPGCSREFYERLWAQLERLQTRSDPKYVGDGAIDQVAHTQIREILASGTTEPHIKEAECHYYPALNHLVAKKFGYEWATKSRTVKKSATKPAAAKTGLMYAAMARGVTRLRDSSQSRA